MVILTVCVCVWSVLVDPAWAEVVFIWSYGHPHYVCVCMECASSPSMG